MADNNQVWAVDTPGAPHSAALARQSTYVTTGGVTGIVAASGPGVGTTPGSPMSVRLDPCSVVAASTYAGSYRESYSFAVEQSVDVAVEVTGSSSRTDVIALVVTDPVLEGRDILELDVNGEPVPGSTGIDPREHEYWEAMRFTNVPSSARRNPEAFRQWAQGQSVIHGPVIPYAIVVQGANSTSLEGKVRPFFETVMGRRSNIIAEVPVDSEHRLDGPFTSFKTLGPTVYFDVPWWATRARVKATAQGLSAVAPGSTIPHGWVSGLALGKSMRQYAYYEVDSLRFNAIVWADLAIPESRRGSTQDFRLRVTNAESGSYIRTMKSTHYYLEVEFLEDPSAVDNSDPDLEG